MITYDGHQLDTLGICGEPEITTASFAPDLRDSQSFDGSRFIGSHIAACTVMFKMAIIGDDNERRTKLSTLAQWLHVDEPKALVLPDSSSWYYLAVPSAGFTPERHIDGEVVELSFTLTDPVAYGEERTITIPSGGSANVTIGGTAAAMPYIASAQSVTPNSSTKLYGLRLDDGDIFCLTTGGTGAFTINRLDMGERVVYVNSALTLPTLDSDWFVLTPGTHKLQNHQGSGQLVLKYRERWL